MFVGTGVVTVMAKKLVVSPGFKRETHPTMSSFRSESPDGWIFSLKMKSCLETVWLFGDKQCIFIQCLFYTQSSVDRLEPTTMVCTSFLFVLDHCNVGRIDRDSGSRSMDHGRINREAWQ